MSVEKMVSKLATQAMEKSVQETASLSKAPQGQSFAEILNNVQSGMDFAEMLGVGNNELSSTSNMEALSGEGITPLDVTEQVNMGTLPDTGRKVVDMLGDVNKGQMQMDSLVNHILYGGKRFSNQELLVIQAHVFHFHQMTELTVKLAEQTVGSMK